MTRSPLLRSVSLVVAALVPAIATAQEPTKVEGQHVDVLCHFPNSEVGKAAADWGDAGWARALATFGGEPVQPAKKPTIHLYRTPKEFQEVDKKLTGGQNELRYSFTVAAEMAAHIAVRPGVSDPVLNAHGPGQDTLRWVARECAELARLAAYPSAEKHPIWLRDGVTQWVAAELSRERKELVEIADDPMYGTQLLRCFGIVKADLFPGFAGVFASEFGKLDDLQREALAFVGFDWLMAGKAKKKLPKLLADLREVEADAFEGAYPKLVKKRLGSEGSLRKLDSAFKKLLRNAKPTWVMSGPVLEMADGKVESSTWFQAGFQDAGAFALRNDAEAGYKGYTISGQVSIHDSENRQMIVYVGQDDRKGFVSVGLIADHGVEVYEHHYSRPAEFKWQQLATGKSDKIKTDEPVEFAIKVSKKGQLTVTVGGDKLADIDLGNRAMNGKWGVGASDRAAGTWMNVKIKRG